MANFTLFKSLPKFGHFGAANARRSTTSHPTLIFASNPKFIQTNSPQDPLEAKDAINPGANEGQMPGEDMMNDMACSTAQHMIQKAKDTAQRAKENLMDNAKNSEEFMKANAKCVENCMNTKNSS